MEAILAANPAKGSIAAVWAAWDQPALVAPCRPSKRPAAAARVS